MVNRTFIDSLNKTINSPKKSAELLDFLKILALERVPKNKNNALKAVFVSNDYNAFLGLLTDSVPNIHQEIIDFVSKQHES